jgi:hypothetical protein
MARLALLAASAVATLLLMAAEATASPPTRITLNIDATFASPFLTGLCGIPVSLHEQGTVTVTLFYDQSGAVIRELDTIPGGFSVTRFSPADEGGTGKSSTSVEHTSYKTLYPEGTALGDPAIIIATGLQRTSGPGNPRFVGRQVFEAVIVGETLEGIPVADPVALISQSGQFGDPEAFFQAVCDTLTDP